MNSSSWILQSPTSFPRLRFLPSPGLISKASPPRCLFKYPHLPTGHPALFADSPGGRRLQSTSRCPRLPLSPSWMSTSIALLFWMTYLNAHPAARPLAIDMGALGPLYGTPVRGLHTVAVGGALVSPLPAALLIMTHRHPSASCHTSGLIYRRLTDGPATESAQPGNPILI
jgi:hypothetical protein